MTPAGDDVAATMRAAVYVGDGRLEVQDLAVPELAAHEALIAVSHCGICGTDLHLVQKRYARAGSVLGHEWAGTISALGAEAAATGSWTVGDRVVAGPRPSCGDCYACRRDRPSACRQA